VVRIELSENGVAITPSSAGFSDLAPLQVGQLRAALRDAIIALDEMQHSTREIPAQRRRPATSVRSSWPGWRTRSALRSLRRALLPTSTRI